MDALGKRVASGLRVIGIPTSEATAQQARSLGIPISTLDEHPEFDLTIDGADEVELGTLNLIKGRGGALLREKIVASASKRLVIIVDESKLVERLGSHFAASCGGGSVRMAGGGAKAGSAGRESSSCGRARMENPLSPTAATTLSIARLGQSRRRPSWNSELNSIVGVVEHGLFLGMAYAGDRRRAGRRQGFAAAIVASAAKPARIRRRGHRSEIAAQPHAREIVVQRRNIGLRRKYCLVLQSILVYICQNRRRTGIWIVGLVGDLIPGVAVESRNSQRYDGKAGWPPQRTEGRYQREASKQIQRGHER